MTAMPTTAYPTTSMAAPVTSFLPPMTTSMQSVAVQQPMVQEMVVEPQPQKGTAEYVVGNMTTVPIPQAEATEEVQVSEQVVQGEEQVSIVTVPVERIVEKVVEIPEVQTVEKIVEVVQVQTQVEQVESIVEQIVEIPEVQTVEKI